MGGDSRRPEGQGTQRLRYHHHSAFSQGCEHGGEAAAPQMDLETGAEKRIRRDSRLSCPHAEQGNMASVEDAFLDKLPCDEYAYWMVHAVQARCCDRAFAAAYNRLECVGDISSPQGEIHIQRTGDIS